MTWRGKELATHTANGVSSSYSYNEDGIRTSKTVGGVTTTYSVVGSTILSQTKGSSTLIFLYDGFGDVVGFKKGNVSYYYLKNLQGDVMQIISSTGDVIVEYTYDPWGKVLSITGTFASTLGNENPFRYRSYYYDDESGFYYLNSRYYDPEICRFISADEVGVLTATPTAAVDKNLFAYCDNNPVIREDNGGAFWDTALDVLSLGMSIVEVISNPSDIGAWVGLAGDAIDLIPFVTGVGEVTKAVTVTVKAADNTEDVVKSARRLYSKADKSNMIRKMTGSYEIEFASGKNYVGKGGYYRATISAKYRARINKDTVTSITWKSAKDKSEAFYDEYKLMSKRGVNNDNTYNKIWSPGKNDYIKIWNFRGR